MLLFTLLFRQTTVAMNGSPSYAAFSFPKLNGSPSRPTVNHTGSGSGFMGFGPTGFTTPMDTVLDRFGRTGTIFPSTGMTGGVGPPTGFTAGFSNATPGSGMNDSVTTPSYATPGGGPVGGSNFPGGPHRTLPSVVPPFGRSNSLGRSLPPIPSKPPGQPQLIRRRTFEDEEDTRTDWI